VIARGTRRPWIAGAAGALLVIAAAAVGVVIREEPVALPARPAEERPELLVLTSLPIAFPEEFTLEGGGSPAMTALESRYRVVPISTADAASLAGHKLLLMAQPNAQPAEILVELDEWVRKGGRVLLLADPMLDWPSEKPLGDLSRPPLAFPDTGLLGHWGLRLDAPDAPGPATFSVGGRKVHALSPGTLVATGPGCSVAGSGFIARCQIEGGAATVVADADFADVERRRDPARFANLEFLLAELNRLEG
jgi:hypothetical protein